jgi:hypothetical protein
MRAHEQKMTKKKKKTMKMRERTLVTMCWALSRAFQPDSDLMRSSHLARSLPPPRSLPPAASCVVVAVGNWRPS